MSERITVKITPLKHYNKYALSSHILCEIDFSIKLDGDIHCFRSESSNQCIKELLSEIDSYLSGKLSPDTELCYYVPWIMGNHCVYPYSFKINSPNSWSFRYKRNQNDDAFDFQCDISKDDILSMREQIEEQFSKIDWDSLGKTPLYTFALSDRAFEWCYSAKAFCKSLNHVCRGKHIKAIYVSATNYANPLRIVEENYVNYYVGSELIIELEDVLLDLLICAEGLFQWRVFNKSEYTSTGPTLKFIEDGDEEFCDIGNVYGAFKVDYTASIDKICVEDTEDWPWRAKGFDESQLGNPVELPKTILFELSNHYTLSLHGLDDDFAIQLSPSNT